MRTLEIEREIPAETCIDTTYGCDLCDFTSDSEEAVIRHEGTQHSFTDQKTIEGNTYLWFETEDAFRRYQDPGAR